LNALMQEKRNKKLKAIKREAIPPELIGSENYKYLIIGWGSTYYAIKEALERLERDDVAFLHFKQVYPLSEKSKEYFERAEVLIDAELNVTAQFAQLLKKEFGISVDYTVLKYNGRPFSVEELVEKLSVILEGRE